MQIHYCLFSIESACPDSQGFEYPLPACDIFSYNRLTNLDLKCSLLEFCTGYPVITIADCLHCVLNVLHIHNAKLFKHLYWDKSK